MKTVPEDRKAAIMQLLAYADMPKALRDDITQLVEKMIPQEELGDARLLLCAYSYREWVRAGATVEEQGIVQMRWARMSEHSLKDIEVLDTEAAERNNLLVKACRETEAYKARHPDYVQAKDGIVSARNY